MFTVELYAKIRHAVMVKGPSRREAAKRFGIHRDTITKMLSFFRSAGLSPARMSGIQEAWAIYGVDRRHS